MGVVQLNAIEAADARPSRSRSTRLARRPSASLWVTSTTVAP